MNQRDVIYLSLKTTMIEEVIVIKYSRDTLSRACWDTSKLKDRLLHFMSPTTKKEAQFLGVSVSSGDGISYILYI